MNLIYVDESGDDGFLPPFSDYQPGNTPTRYFQRCGIIIHDKRWNRINQEINNYKRKNSMPLDLELHATEILNGNTKYTDSVTKKRKLKKNWYGRNFTSRGKREKFLVDLCSFISSLDLTIIAILIDKSEIRQDSENKFRDMPKNTSWEFLIERVNLFLSQSRDRKGMFIADAININIEKKHREWATNIYKNSTHVQEGRFVESILFEPSASSNLLQLADLVSFAIFKSYESKITKYYDKIKNKIFRVENKIQGYGIKVWPENSM